jgi:hypothetical protein
MPTQMNPTKYLKGSCQHCDGHIEFPAEMAGLATTCPHCGQTTELLLATPPEESCVSRKAILWTTAAILILALGLLGALVALKRAQRLVQRQKQRADAVAASLGTTNTSTAPSPEPPSTAHGDLEVSDISLQKTAGTSLVYALGTVRNSSNRQRFGVKVELALLDAAGQKLGTATDYRQVLEPGGQWRFKALVVDSKAVTARLESIKEDQ